MSRKKPNTEYEVHQNTWSASFRHCPICYSRLFTDREGRFECFKEQCGYNVIEDVTKYADLKYPTKQIGLTNFGKRAIYRREYDWEDS